MNHIKTHKKIAVIGAGLAGLTAAYRLTQCCLDIDLFDAKNRVGGRVFTILILLRETYRSRIRGENVAGIAKIT